MSSVKLDARNFQVHIKTLVKYWEDMPEAFQGAQAILVPVGESNEATVYQKSTALQTWLFLYEFPDTNLLLTKEKLFVLASQKKCQILQQLNELQLAERKIEVVTFARSNKDEAASKQSIDEFIKQCCKHSKLGVFGKDKASGKWITEWQKAYANDTAEEVDVSAGVATVLAIKDENEVKNMRLAGKMSSLVMKNYFTEEMAACVDDERPITHEKFAEKVENVVYDERARRKLQFPQEATADFIDNCYTPIIQSGGNYDLKPSAISDGSQLKAGVILCSLGVRYRNYCSNVGRTFLIDPTKEQERQYRLLLDLQEHLMKQMRDSIQCSDLYAKGLAFLEERDASMLKCFVKNIGFVTGLEFRDSSFVLNAKNQKELYKNMSVNLAIGFQDLQDDSGRKYSLLLADTVLVGSEDSQFLTESPRDFRYISFFFADDGEEGDQAAKESQEKSSSSKKKFEAKAGTAILKTKLRSGIRSEEHLEAEQKRRDHQRQLMQERIKEGMQRYNSGADITGLAGDEKKPIFRKFESYKQNVPLPKEARQNKIIIDKRNETVLLPIMGMSVPFHLNTIKNVTKSEEGQYFYLRFNFTTPGQNVRKDQQQTLTYDDQNATFVKSLSFRSTDTIRYQELYRQLTELKREMQKKEAERLQKSDLIQQASLLESKRPLAILTDVNIRPGLEGKKLPGDVQLHTNGLRYQPVRGDQRVDVVFSNIKHLFFQPCDHELYVILHCHLKNPIMVGKKKTKDLQFYRDVSEGSFDDTSNRRRRQYYNDEDELMAEQEERKRRQRTNKEFKAFAEKISEVSGFLEADVPIRELSFNGVPQRTNVLLQPTTECLVHLTDPPFTVITLADVEIAYLERVQFHLKNFDLVFVLKDFKLAPVHVNTIPMKQLDPVKEWLDSVDIPYAEGPFNLNWPNIMKNINEDPFGFYQDGGWLNLASEGGGGGSDQSDGEMDEDSASEFEPSSSDAEEEEEEESSEEEDSSDFDEDDDSEGGGSEADENEDDEDEEEGEDWDELERKAKHEDDRKRSKVSRREDEDVDIRPKKKRK